MFTLHNNKKNNTILKTLLILGLLVTCFVPSIHAQPATHGQQKPDETLALITKKIAQKKLAQHPTWLKMLYFSEKTQKSDIKQTHYFLAKNGKTDPHAEMLATVTGLLHPKNEKNKSATCQFPARRYWLEQQLNLTDDFFPNADCPQFKEWFSAINPHKITLIFASDYLNNPSSMFGHTLLRVDQKNGKDLLAYAINYAANTPEGSGFVYAVRGLTGGYDAAFSLMPYYEKVKGYGDIESRDMWEYTLNLTPEQSQQLVRYVWELGGVKFPYYFLGDNCSYKILRLLDVVKPSLNSQAWFVNEAIPAQTVKALQHRSDIIESVNFRPSLESQLKAQWFLYGDDIAKQAHQFTKMDSKTVAKLASKKANSAETAKILEMAYDDLYLQFLKRDGDQDLQRKRLRKLLSVRSKNKADKQRPDKVISHNNPAHGHDAKRVTLGTGYDGNEGYALFGYRIAYHDSLDRHLGYRQGMSINALDFKLRAYKYDVKLSDALLIGINSYSPVTPFHKPLSWGIEGGMTRNLTTDKLVGYLDYKVGYATSFGQNKKHEYDGNNLTLTDTPSICFGQTNVKAQVGQTLDLGWRMAVGLKAGCLVQTSNNSRFMVEAIAPYWFTTDFKDLKQKDNLNTGFTPTANLSIHYDIDKNQAIRLESNVVYHELLKEKAPTNVQLGYLIYF